MKFVLMNGINQLITSFPKSGRSLWSMRAGIEHPSTFSHMFSPLVEGALPEQTMQNRLTVG